MHTMAYIIYPILLLLRQYLTIQGGPPPLDSFIPPAWFCVGYLYI